MWAALYTVTPELFPTKARGTGNGLASSANRIFGVMSPIIALYADLTVGCFVMSTGKMLMVLLIPRPRCLYSFRERCLCLQELLHCSYPLNQWAEPVYEVSKLKCSVIRWIEGGHSNSRL
jgi:hypothetical protein